MLSDWTLVICIMHYDICMVQIGDIMQNLLNYLLILFNVSDLSPMNAMSDVPATLGHFQHYFTLVCLFMWCQCSKSDLESIVFLLHDFSKIVQFGVIPK